MRKFKKKLIPKHQAFVNQYVQSRYNPIGIYRRAYFCEDEDIAFVLRVKDYDDYIDGDEDESLPDTWGCVNMAHQLLVPFEYQRVYDFGRFLIGRKQNGYDLYNKKGQKLYEINGVRKTPHKAYKLIYEEDWNSFRISIRKMSISKGLYKRFYVLDNGLAFVQNEDEKVGLILFTKLKLPFDYYAIAVPQNGYTLGIMESDKENDTIYYDCQLIKVRTQIKREDSIHPTGINLFTRKTLNEVNAYFKDIEQFEKECNSIVCYNQNVSFDGCFLEFFPYDTKNVGEEEEEPEPKEYHGTWDDYTWEDSIYDALGGELDAIWNIDR